MSEIVGWTNWIGVVAEDVARQRAFYRDVLGLGEIHAGARALHPTEGGPEFAGYWCHVLDAEDNVFAITQRLGPPWVTVEKES